MSKEQTENPGLFAQFVFKTRVFLKCQTSHHEKKITPTERCCWKMVCFRPSFYWNFSGLAYTLEYEGQEAKVMKVWFRCFSFSIGFCFLLGDFLLCTRVNCLVCFILFPSILCVQIQVILRFQPLPFQWLTAGCPAGFVIVTNDR